MRCRRRSPSRVLVVAAVMLALTAPGLAGSAERGEPGTLSVIDGDTLDDHGIAIDLAGIDAPELGQVCVVDQEAYPCGLEAAFDLKKLLAFESVTCSPEKGGSGAFVCATRNGSLSLRMAEEGLVVARSDPVLQTAESAARRVPLGIWRGEFVDPGAWRDGVRLPEESAAGPCPVLGVRVDGSPRYLVPTDPDYERWQDRSVDARFCTDEEARAAGYTHLASRPAATALAQPSQ